MREKKPRRADKPAAATPPPADRPPQERILHGAFAAFMELGYGKTSMLEIATRAHVSKRDLYALFPDKSAILAACIGSRARLMRRPLELPPPRDRSALVETLVAFGITSLREGTRPDSVAALRLAVTETASDAGAVFHAAAIEANRTALVEFMANAQARKLLRNGEPARMAGIFLGMLWRNLLVLLLLRIVEPPSEAEMERAARNAAELLLLVFGPSAA